MGRWRGKAMKRSNKNKPATINQEVFPFNLQHESLWVIDLDIVLQRKASQLFELGVRIIKCLEALNKYMNMPSSLEIRKFLHESDKLDSTQKKIAAAGKEFNSMRTFQQCSAFVMDTTKRKIPERECLITLCAACFVFCGSLCLVEEEKEKLTFVILADDLTEKSCEAIGYWTRKLEEKKNSRKGGQKLKMTIPILLAIVKYLEEKPSRKGNTNYQIAEGFKKKVKDNTPIIVEYAGCEWDVFFKEEKISAVPDTKYKAQHHQEIAFSTFMNSYITEAKNIIKGESKYDQYVVVPECLK
jgi:hypothetical protein